MSRRGDRGSGGRGRAVRIGLTGPIGCGKSTVAGLLAERGALVVDADAAARAVTQPGSPGHDAVLAVFGPAVAGPNGTLDRAALAAIVFRDPERLRELEAIVHPAVRPLILAALGEADRDRARVVAIEAIKLVESGLGAVCDEIWLVTCSPDDQLRRLRDRGSTLRDAAARIDAQGDIRDRLRPAATRIIDTTGTLDDVRSRVAAALDAAFATAPGERLDAGPAE
jgi:dephospho-CoA kinase